MAVAAPVLEKNLTDTQEEVRQEREAYFRSLMSEDEIHNSKIRDNYARLINPEMKLGDLLGYDQQEEKAEEVKAEEKVVVNTVAPVRPYLVQNARADAEIFRADSAVNMRAQTVEVVDEAEPVEEESDDLRPTLTTRQYQTVDVSGSKEGKIKNVSSDSKRIFNKKEKLIIAVVVAVVVALFVLIIVNSAIISALNSDLSTLQSALTDVKGAYSGVSNSLVDTVKNEYQMIVDYANSNGMVKP